MVLSFLSLEKSLRMESVVPQTRGSGQALGSEGTSWNPSTRLQQLGDPVEPLTSQSPGSLACWSKTMTTCLSGAQPSSWENTDRGWKSGYEMRRAQ